MSKQRLPSNRLSRAELALLRWAVDRAEDWRGAMVGNTDPEPLREFDANIAKLRNTLTKVRHMNQTLKDLAQNLESSANSEPPS